ncbi:hypothetical protein C942_04936 [Photobacterium marinum]|uniref:Uncharacterized protein n=1 Tax=Photobacterium marinum TaxID=1056511 RepID=L8JFL0_9GAMM|nr:hypothetical protein C942_04936 [Photobacterium marinum]
MVMISLGDVRHSLVDENKWVNLNELACLLEVNRLGFASDKALKQYLGCSS